MRGAETATKAHSISSGGTSIHIGDLIEIHDCASDRHHEAEVLVLIFTTGEWLPCTPPRASGWICCIDSKHWGDTKLTISQKLSPTAANEIQQLDGTDSPPYSPTPSEMERPTFSPDIEAELHRACAIIVRETNPPTDEDEDVPDHQETLRKYEEYKAHKAAEQLRAAKKDRYSSSRPRDEPRQPAPKLAAYVPTHAARDNMAKLPSFTFEPREPTDLKYSASNRNKGKEVDDPLAHVRATLDTRPKTSAAACTDYTGPSADTSASTSRTNTTYDDRGRRISTGLTSAALTPADDKRASLANKRVSEQVLPDGTSASFADATAKAWMMQELARRRAEYDKSGNAGRPGSTRSVQPRQYEIPERPSSRAGSIAGSVRDGIVGYIRPRASMDSMLSTKEGLSRTQSRSSSVKSSGGSKFSWRPKDLRRKGSWSSFRSAKPQPEKETPGADKGPNLNRALPALPGLDQYKEKKQPTHVALLMRGGCKTTEKKSHVEATIIDDDGIQRTLSQSEERRRQKDMRKAVEEKMRKGAIVASEKPVHLSVESQYQQSLGRPSTTISAITNPSVTNRDTPRQAEQSEKKPGLKQRLTKFWGIGGDKRMGDQRNNFGKMVVAN